MGQFVSLLFFTVIHAHEKQISANDVLNSYLSKLNMRQTGGTTLCRTRKTNERSILYETDGNQSSAIVADHRNEGA